MPRRGDVLVVEDDLAIGQFIFDALAEEGYRVRVVHDSTQALDACDIRISDLLICDLRVPYLPGRDLIMQLQPMLPPAVPIVVMTTNSQPARELDDLNLAGCLITPFVLADLLHCVANDIRH